jgi:hypothetical protein
MIEDRLSFSHLPPRFRRMIDSDALDHTMRRFPFLIEAARSARRSETWVGEISPVIDRRMSVIVAEYRLVRRELIKQQLRDAIARTDCWLEHREAARGFD